MGESYAPPSASEGASLSARPRVEVGMLRNGLGSIRNLELLIKSIKVGQKGLFAAVAAVHADCAPMIANVAGVARALVELGVDAECAERLSSALGSSLTDLEHMLAGAVESGRLSVAQRLKLERDLSRCARELGSALPLVSLLERAAQPRPVELTPIELVHSSSAERSDQKIITVYRNPAPSPAGHGVHVDLEAAKMLVAIGVALVTDGHALEGHPAPHPRLGFEVQPGGALTTSLFLEERQEQRRGEPEGARLTVAALRLTAPSLLCAEVAARRLGARFDYARDARRVCIYWPVS
jgi:hypothetical protein